jgi:hypothetical protein
MNRSRTIATSVVAASSGGATATRVSPALIGLLGTVVGAVIAQGVACSSLARIAMKRRVEQHRSADMACELWFQIDV